MARRVLPDRRLLPQDESQRSILGAGDRIFGNPISAANIPVAQGENAHRIFLDLNFETAIHVIFFIF